jgi:hypothetical protein
MSQVAISGNASGTGTLTIAAPNTNSNYTLTLPQNTGTLISTASAGTVLQVVSATTSTSFSTTSTSFVTTSFSASITPSSASSKVLVQTLGGVFRTPSGVQGYLTIYRGATNLGDTNRGLQQVGGQTGQCDFPIGIGFLDSPSTTSSTTYTIYIRASSSTVTFQVDAATCTLLLQEIAA